MLQVIFIAIVALMALGYVFESVAGENTIEDPVTLEEMPTMESSEPKTAA